MSMTLSIDGFWEIKGALAFDRPPTRGERSQVVRRVRRPSQTLCGFSPMKLPARHQSEMSERYLPSPGSRAHPRGPQRRHEGKVGLRVSIPIILVPRAVLERDRFPFGAWVPHLAGLHWHPLPAGPAQLTRFAQATSGSQVSYS